MLAQRSECQRYIRFAQVPLKNHEVIAVMRSNKGNKMIIINKDDYKAKMHDHLTDTSTYIHVPKDPTAKVQKRNNELQ